MLQHQMRVLNGVKEYSTLFKKELYKTINWLNENELKYLYKWLKQNFYTRYGDVIEEAFGNIFLDTSNKYQLSRQFTTT